MPASIGDAFACNDEAWAALERGEAGLGRKRKTIRLTLDGRYGGLKAGDEVARVIAVARSRPWFDSIHELSVIDLPLAPADLKALGNLPHLGSIALYGMDCEPRLLMPFAEREGLLRLVVSDVTIDQAFLDAFADLPGLVELSFNAPWITDAALWPFHHLQSLEDVSFPGLDIGDKTLDWLGRQRSLREIDLTGCGLISDAAMRRLSSCTAMRVLCLSYVPITDAGLDWVDRCGDLQSVYLDNTGIGDGTLYRLAEVGVGWDACFDCTQITAPALFCLLQRSSMVECEASGCPNLPGEPPNCMANDMRHWLAEHLGVDPSRRASP
ncbi:MAG: hypothetical protein AAF797_12435 [Planctomycetota bacterium]